MNEWIKWLNWCPNVHSSLKYIIHFALLIQSKKGSNFIVILKTDSHKESCEIFLEFTLDHWLISNMNQEEVVSFNWNIRARKLNS